MLKRLIERLAPYTVRIIAWLVLAGLLAGFLFLQSCQTARTAKTKARLSTNQTEAAIASGVDAVETVGSVHAAEVTIDVITRENERAIRTAPGAAAPVDPDLHATGLRALCARAAYRGSEQCLQFADPE